MTLKLFFSCRNFLSAFLLFLNNVETCNSNHRNFRFILKSIGKDVIVVAFRDDMTP